MIASLFLATCLIGSCTSRPESPPTNRTPPSARHFKERVTVLGEVTKSKTTLTPVRATSFVRMIRYSSNSESSQCTTKSAPFLSASDKRSSFASATIKRIFLSLLMAKKCLASFRSQRPSPPAPTIRMLQNPFDWENASTIGRALTIVREFSEKRNTHLKHSGKSPSSSSGQDRSDVHWKSLRYFDEEVESWNGDVVGISVATHLVSRPNDDFVPDLQVIIIWSAFRTERFDYSGNFVSWKRT